MTRRWATSMQRGASLGAIHTTAWERDPELAHMDYRSAWDETVAHRAGVDLDAPVALDEVRVRWAPGHAPRAFRLLVRREHGSELEAYGDGSWLGCDDGEVSEIALRDAVVSGIAIELAPGGGHPERHAVLGIRALALVAVDPPEISVARVLRDAAIEEPASPFPCSELPGRVLELGGAQAIRIRARAARPLGQLVLSFTRIGEVGTPRDLARLCGSLRARVAGEEHDSEIEVLVRDERVGKLSGVTDVVVRFVRETVASTVDLALHERPAIAALEGVRWSDAPDAVGGAPLDVERAEPGAIAARAQIMTAREDVLGNALRAAGTTLAAARRLVDAPIHAGTVGAPGASVHAGVAPDGTIQLRPFAPAPHAGSMGACLHARIAIGGIARPARILGPETGALTLAWSSPDLEASAKIAFREDAFVTRVEITATRLVDACLTLALRDWLLPVPLDLRARAAGDDRLLLELEDGTVLADVPRGVVDRSPLETSVTFPLAPDRRLDLRFPLHANANADADADAHAHAHAHAALSFALPGEWDALARGLLDQIHLFLRPDGTLPYGLWPSMYDGDVYGLEEEWALYALALWGNVELASNAFCATYLTDEHLSKTHYLRDLRSGLVPMQAWKLARLRGEGDVARGVEGLLDDAGRARVRACGAWTRDERRKTAAPHVAGLLPPYRYGGDLDFPAQSLSADVANWAGVRALADLFPEDAPSWRAEADDYRSVIRSAFETARAVDARTGLTHVPLHLGGGDRDDPGDYYQLLLCGVIETCDFFAPGDPVLASMHAYLEESGRLRLALPRFDAFATSTNGLGIDAHYALGYLLGALRAGTPARREIFWTGLLGLVAAAMDRDVLSFREVSPLLPRGLAPPMSAHLPGRHLGLTEPCIGGPGVVLQLLRHALVAEALDADGRPSRVVRVLPAPLPEWWDEDGEIWLAGAPTHGGPVTVRVENRLRARAEIDVVIDAPRVDELIVHAPGPPGWRRTDAAADIDRLPRGSHRLSFRFAR